MTAQFRVSAWAGSGHTTVAAVTGAVRDAADAGFDGVWLPQTLSVDALSALAVAASQVPDIHVGTAVVPLQGRHPFPLAQQALTACRRGRTGRFTLGVGVTHAFVSETFYGFPVPRRGGALPGGTPGACTGLLGPDRKVNVAGRFVVTQVGLTMQGPSPSLVVAALGPKMLELAGELVRRHRHLDDGTANPADTHHSGHFRGGGARRAPLASRHRGPAGLCHVRRDGSA